jgi:hypothetical protein
MFASSHGPPDPWHAAKFLNTDTASNICLPPLMEHQIHGMLLNFLNTDTASNICLPPLIDHQIHGMLLVKLATALSLAGGVARSNDGTRLRGDVHLLLIGDPGIGESLQAV